MKKPTFCMAVRYFTRKKKKFLVKFSVNRKFYSKFFFLTRKNLTATKTY